MTEPTYSKRQQEYNDETRDSLAGDTWRTGMRIIGELEAERDAIKAKYDASANINFAAKYREACAERDLALADNVAMAEREVECCQTCEVFVRDGKPGPECGACRDMHDAWKSPPHPGQALADELAKEKATRAKYQDVVYSALVVFDKANGYHAGQGTLVADLVPCAKALLDELARLRKETTWRQMETAPLDGSEVLLFVERRAGIPGKCLVGHYMPGGYCIEDHPAIESGWYFWTGAAFDLASRPIAWKPISSDTRTAALEAKLTADDSAKGE